MQRGQTTTSLERERIAVVFAVIFLLLRLFGRPWYAHLVMAIVLQDACLHPKQLLHLGSSRLALMLTATILSQKLVQAVTLILLLFLVDHIDVLKARVLHVVLHIHAALSNLVQNPPVIRVRGRFEIFNQLVRR